MNTKPIDNQDYEKENKEINENNQILEKELNNINNEDDVYKKKDEENKKRKEEDKKKKRRKN